MKANTTVLLLLVAITAAVIGFAVNSPDQSSPDSATALLKAQLLSVDPNDLTQMKPATVESKLGDLTLVNFWATWCAPCREEMPMFEELYRQTQQRGKSFVVVGVTIDSVEKSQPMLDSMGISYPILYAENTGMEIMAAVGNQQGLLPYTLLLNNNGQVLESKLGRIHAADVQTWLQQHLN